MSSHSNAHSSVVELISSFRFKIEIKSVILILGAMIIGFEQIKKEESCSEHDSLICGGYDGPANAFN